MERDTGLGCLAALVLVFGVGAAAAGAAQATGKGAAVGFEKVTGRAVLDSSGRRCAQLMGEAKLTTEAKHGRAALDLGGADAKGVVDFGPSFGMSKEGTLELWCKPRTLSNGAVLVGKWGVLNIQIMGNKRSIRFSVMPQGGGIVCESPPRIISAGRWQRIKASWGRAGIVLFLDRKVVARAAFPAEFQWRDLDRHFLLGNYTWPGGYDVWCFDGLIDGFSFKPTQEPPPAGSPSVAPEQSVVLKPRLKETPKPSYGVPVPPEVSGRVTLDAKGLAGVSVTDGYSVVKTDAQGAYTLASSPDAVFIYVTKPAGHDVEGEWYKPVAAEVDFALKPAASDETEYTFVHVTDTHIHNVRRGLAGLSRFVQEVNALTPKPAFVVNSGDLLSLDKAITASPATGHAWIRNYVGIMNHLSMPHYNVAGDHTDSSYRLKEFPRGDHRCGKPLYWEYLGPHFFSFEYGKIHFVSVDFGYHLGKRQIRVNGRNLEYPTNQVQPMHVEWMKQDMANRTKGSFVVTTAESDLTRFCPGFLEMAKQHDVRFQLTGNDHIVAHKARPVPYRTGGSLSGCWWNPKCRGLCPDLSPQGYLIYRVSGEKMECFYKGLGRRLEILSPRTGAPLKARVAIRAHIVQPKPNETLQYTLNGKDWKAMPEIGRPFSRTLHEATVDTTPLSDGLLNCRVRSTADGEVRSRVFVIANGRAPAPPGGDASLTFKVNPSGHVPKAPDGKVDVLFNGKVIGVLVPKARKEYSFRIPASGLKKANILSFRFAQPSDDMGLSAPVLTFQGKPVEDPRHSALKQVRTAHWGAKSADWGGFVVGNGKLNEGPFARKQNVFCFVLPGAEATKQPGK